MTFKILPILGREKEKETVKCFLKHTEIINNMGPLLKQSTAEALDKKNFKKVCAHENEINTLEESADVMRRKTAALLFQGAFLPVMRENLYELSGRVDDVADTIKNSANMMCYLKGRKVPDNVAKLLKKLADNAAKCASLMNPMMVDLFENRKIFDEHVKNIKDIEKSSDDLQREMFDIILLTKKLDPVAVQVIGWVGHTLSEVTDEAKRVSDTMVLLKILKQA